MRIIRTYLREGLFERNIEWSPAVNLVFSEKNTCGKTTLMRAMLYSLGYPVPNTKNIKFEKCVIITEIENALGKISIRREGSYLQVITADDIKVFTLPIDQDEFHQLLWGTDNKELLDNIIGACYIDQEKGWTLLNRGKVIGNIRYSIEQLVRALSGRQCSELILQEKRIEFELKKYRQMQSIAKYKEEINEYKDELISESYDEELEKQLEVLNYELSIQNKELKRIDNVIKKNESFRKYVENMKIRVRASSGEVVPVNKETIIDMNEYSEMLRTKRRIVSNEINSIKRAIEKIKIQMPQEDAQLSFVKTDSIIATFDKKIVKFDVDAIDEILSEMIKDKFLAIKEITSFALFPVCGFPWNHYLLESYCYSYSKRYCLKVVGFNDKNAGIIAENDVTDGYTELLARAAARAKIELSMETVGQYYFETGYMGKRSFADLESTVERAKALREDL